MIRQLINFVTIQQEDGSQLIVKYMLSHYEDSLFGIIVEKHVVMGGEMYFIEEVETKRLYDITKALAIAKQCADFKVLPISCHDIEEDLWGSLSLQAV